MRSKSPRRGPDAEDALRALQEAVKAGLGERVEFPAVPPSSAVPPSRTGSPNQGPVGVSGGIAIGQLFFAQAADAEVPTDKVDDTGKEKRKLRKAIEKAKAELARDEESLRQSLGKEEAEIFRAQALVLEDPALLEAAERSIEDDHENGAKAWQRSYQTVGERLSRLGRRIHAAARSRCRGHGTSRLAGPGSAARRRSLNCHSQEFLSRRI